MNHQRPKNLNLFSIKFPIPAIVSILHRLSGAFLFILIPFILWGFSYSLSQAGFATWQDWLNSFFIKLIFWALFVPFCFHFIAGIRHLLMDVHIGSTLKGGRISSYVTFIFFIIVIILAGIWLW